MLIGFFSETSSTIIYVVNDKSEINSILSQYSKESRDLIYDVQIPGKIDKPFIDEDGIEDFLGDF